MSSSDAQPVCILIAALGGEGGGVLMNWIVEAARLAGLPVQATSVPGVAQRTGSTSYYIEMLPHAPAKSAPPPVFALVPMPGRVDAVVASELVEAGRILERGFVSPKRTTLITSTSRVYTTAEKMVMSDGRFPPEKIEAAARAVSKRMVALDLDALARQHGTMVSATMFGALAGTGALPFERALCETVMGSGRSAAASRAGFAAAFEAVQSPPKAPVPPEASPMPASLSAAPSGFEALVATGRARCSQYQNAAYGALYETRVRRLERVAATTDTVARHALEEAARRLALWMTYEDIPRVAELKIKPERIAGIRADAEMSDAQIVKVTEYLKPGGEEIAAMLPVAWGRRLMRRIEAGRSIPFAGRGIHVTTTNVGGYAVMRGLAALKRIRPRSLRFAEEQAEIERWLTAMETVLPKAPSFAAGLAELPRLLKGYGDTQTRGKRGYLMVFDGVVMPAIDAGTEAATAPLLRKAIAAALADPDHATLGALLQRN